VLVIAVVLGACGPQVPSLESAIHHDNHEAIEFATAGSLALSEDGHLVSGPPLTLSGELQTPGGLGPFPGIVLMHGCAGTGAAERGWEAALRHSGYATFVVDSLDRRGLGEVCVDARALLPAQRIPDAYGALRLLSTHPSIDRRRIALMGFSHGGIVATLSATTWAHNTFGGPGQPRFRGFIALYPYCNWTFPEMRHLSAPLRIYSGALDDWTPSEPCERMVAELRAAGYDAAITVYPGARHSFDEVGLPTTRLPFVSNAARCTPRLGSILGPLENAAELAGCLRQGATVGWNPEATAQVRASVLKELRALLPSPF
jgi:dienelactone hydrolase